MLPLCRTARSISTRKRGEGALKTITFPLTIARLLPTLSLGSQAAYLDGHDHILSIITSAGQLHSFNLQKRKANFPPISIAPILTSKPNVEVTSIAVHRTVPILNCSDGAMYSYDPNLFTWIKLSDKWWSEGSDVWPGRQRNTIQPTNHNIVAWLESKIDAPLDPAAASKKRPEWWNAAMTLGHLENKLQSSQLLDSPVEYKQALLIYAKRISDEGFVAMAEELIKELFGPVYW